MQTSHFPEQKGFWNLTLHWMRWAHPAVFQGQGQVERNNVYVKTEINIILEELWLLSILAWSFNKVTVYLYYYKWSLCNYV